MIIHFIIILIISLILYFYFNKNKTETTNELKNNIKKKEKINYKTKLLQQVKLIEIKNNNNFNILDNKISFRGIVSNPDTNFNLKKVPIYEPEQGGSFYYSNLIKLNNDNVNISKIDYKNHGSYRRRPCTRETIKNNKRKKH